MKKLVLVLLLAVWFFPQQTTGKNTELIFKIDRDLGKLIPVAYVKRPPVPKKIVYNGPYCSCVMFVKSQGINPGSIQYARNWPINSAVPQVGAVVVTRESWAGHVGRVIEVNGDTIRIVEANYRPCKVTFRTLNINDPLIRGYDVI